MDSSDLFTYLIMCSVCGALLALVGGLVWLVVRALRGLKAGETLAGQMGLRFLAAGEGHGRYEGKSHGWYGGEYEGREFALSALGVRSDDSSGRTTSLYLRMALALQLAEPLGAAALRTPFKGGGGATLADTFDLQNAERLPEAAQEALLAFARRGYETGLQADGTLQLSKGLRNLRLCDRAAAKHLLPDTVLPQATAVLIYDQPDAQQKPEAVWRVLAEMTAVAEAVEGGGMIG